MIHGDPHEWTARFRSVDQRLLERILEVWPQCLTVLPAQPEEDFITENLVHRLSKDGVVRRLGYPEYQYEPFTQLPSGAVTSTGGVDFAFILDNDRSMYIAYECKRLNVRNGGTRHSLATPYVNEGLMRFVREQYSEGLPFACMLGYVIDGDITFARTQVWAAIDTNKIPLALTDGPTSIGNPSIERFTTMHDRSGGAIEVRHVFLPFTNFNT